MKKNTTLLFSLLMASFLEATPFEGGNLYMQASGHFGNSIWTKASYGQVGVYFVPDLFEYSRGLVVQEEAFFLSDTQIANSIGLGIRLADWKKNVCGLNAFYDYFKGYYGSMQQLGAGLEVITPTAAFHFNGYLPFHVTGKKGKTKKFDNFVGTYFEFVTPVQFLYQGFEFNFDKGWDLFDAYFQIGGGVYYIDDFFDSNSFGVEAKAEVWWHSFLFMGVLFTRDDIFNGCVQGYFGVSLPFDSLRTNSLPCSSSPCDYLSGKHGKTARIPRWGLSCPGCGAYYSTSWVPQCRN